MFGTVLNQGGIVGLISNKGVSANKIINKTATRESSRFLLVHPLCHYTAGNTASPPWFIQEDGARAAWEVRSFGPMAPFGHRNFPFCVTNLLF
jgi:hypothetical protein